MNVQLNKCARDKINACIQTKWSAYSCNQADEPHSIHSASAVMKNIPKSEDIVTEKDQMNPGGMTPWEEASGILL